MIGTSNPYIPILVIGAIGLGFAIFSVGISLLTGPARYNRAKLDAYECGIEPSPQAAEGGRFPVKYFLTAMLFIIFELIPFQSTAAPDIGISYKNCGDENSHFN